MLLGYRFVSNPGCLTYTGHISRFTRARPNTGHRFSVSWLLKRHVPASCYYQTPLDAEAIKILFISN